MVQIFVVFNQYLKFVRSLTMANLTDYGVLDYEEIADYKIPVETIDTMIGLLSFPIVEESINDSSITIRVFEKSLWSKKEKGYISLKYIDDAQADISKFNYDNNEPIPKFSEILLGLEFSSVYNEYYVHSHFQTYDLGSPRKQVISYGVLIHNIDVKYDVVGQLHLEKLQEDVLSPASNLLGKISDDLRNLRKKLEIFEKFITVK